MATKLKRPKVTRKLVPKELLELDKYPDATGEAPYGYTKAGKPRQKPVPSRTGRKPGSTNRWTHDTRNMVIEAISLEGMDGNGKDGAVGYLRRLAKEDPRAMASLIKSTMPKEINIAVEEDTMRVLDQYTKGLDTRRAMLGEMRVIEGERVA
jgi:hypothetical protein